MPIVSIDGGAKRLGWALLDREGSKPIYLGSGIVELPRGDTPFQEYRLNLIDYYIENLTKPGSIFDPNYLPITHVVNETVPAVGSYGGTQMYLVNMVVTVVQTIAKLNNIPVSQIGATTVHSKIAIKSKSKGITKQQVRNGVIQLLPELESRRKDWVKVFDEPDAIAVGLAHLGFSNG